MKSIRLSLAAAATIGLAITAPVTDAAARSPGGPPAPAIRAPAPVVPPQIIVPNMVVPPRQVNRLDAVKTSIQTLVQRTVEPKQSSGLVIFVTPTIAQKDPKHASNRQAIVNFLRDVK